MNIPTNSGEEWRPVVGWELKYLISNQGRVFSLIFEKEMSASVGNRGYKIISFSRNGVGATFQVHRLIALAFIPNPTALETVNHKDGNPLNNVLGNLEWASRKYQEWHRHNILNRGFGSKSPSSKFTYEKIMELRALSKTTPIRLLAKKYGVHFVTVWRIVKNRAYIVDENKNARPVNPERAFAGASTMRPAS